MSTPRPDPVTDAAPPAASQSPAPLTLVDDDDAVSLKAFLFAAVLWLPLAFFIWFMLRAGVMYPVNKLSALLMTSWMPDLIAQMFQEYGRLVVVTTLPAVGAAPGPDGGIPVMSQDYNTMQFCYGLPVLLGLIMATPLDWTQTFKQVFLGYLALLPAQIVSVTGQVVLDLQYQMGPQAADMVAAHGVSPYLTALWYQFGYLVLPAVTPVVVWAVLNRRFIEKLRDAAYAVEPAAPAAGPTAAAPIEPADKP